MYRYYVRNRKHKEISIRYGAYIILKSIIKTMRVPKFGGNDILAKIKILVMS